MKPVYERHVGDDILVLRNLLAISITITRRLSGRGAERCHGMRVALVSNDCSSRGKLIQKNQKDIYVYVYIFPSN